MRYKYMMAIDFSITSLVERACGGDGTERCLPMMSAEWIA